ncbi:MAG TPA: GAF domain-containing sensor histidine kinase [Solirubrobacteraceae bacterium]|nr:GAF domain-containing sensor histidine kinase [Solirubrobacteraceae bacterium]
MDRATQGILDVARSVLAELDLDLVLERVLAAARELTEARYVALGVLNPARSELANFVTLGVGPDVQAEIGALPRGRGVLGALIEDPKPLRLANVGEHPRSYGLPHGHPPMRTFLGVPILVGGEPFGNLYLTEKAGGAQFTEADEDSVRVLAEFTGVAIDHARRFTGASRRRDELERTVAALEATTQIARAIGGETDPDVVLELVAKRGRALVSARALVIELVSGAQLGREAELVIAAGAGDLPSGVVGRRVPLADTAAAQAIRTGRVQRLEDELNRARFDEHGLGRYGVEAQGGLVVPLTFRGETHGVLLALDRLEDGPVFSVEDERLLEAFASSAATAVATAHSVASERHRQRLAAAEGERQRWARELHDETLQSLSALRIGLSAAGRSEQLETVKQVVGEAVDQLEEAIANLRALITDLRPAALDELGVQAAVEALAERSSRHGIDVDVSVELAWEQGLTPARHAPELETAVYRIVQEALSNATKHGRATRAVVEIREGPTAVQLSIRDNGAGFEVEASDSGGFGILGMHERAMLLGGELTIESEPGSGTIVVGHLPIQRRAGEGGEDAVEAAGSRAEGER